MISLNISEIRRFMYSPAYFPVHHYIPNPGNSVIFLHHDFFGMLSHHPEGYNNHTSNKDEFTHVNKVFSEDSNFSSS